MTFLEHHFQQVDYPPDSMTVILKQIHDRFFKEAFSRTDVVADFIQAYLPEEFSSQLNPETLVREQDSHIDDELSRHYVDLLFLSSWVASLSR